MTSGRKRLIVIVGATGSGKTDLSIAVAEHFGAPIISTDSRQFYRGMAIGTAQPSREQMERVEHHLVDCLDVTEDFNCGAYERAALDRLTQLFRKHDTVVAVGGSGLYIKALCEGMDDLPDAEPALREELLQRLESEGLESLVEPLRE
ncbi:MAG: tRNA (adenosine(37)-N6)-dimethylallyltransferase MiaA, partial [Alistipes sp.]|nr:tRNA (adenosine(37)-N6)-dimethylallyltransferase MiaA [Alistipes sp.]